MQTIWDASGLNNAAASLSQAAWRPKLKRRLLIHGDPVYRNSGADNGAQAKILLKQFDFESRSLDAEII